MTIYDRIDLKIKEMRTTKKAMSENIGLPYSTLMSFYTRRSDNISLDTLKKIALYLNTTLDYLVYGITNESEIKTHTINKLPILGSIPCGTPSDAEENIIGYIDNSTVENHANAYALVAKGDSMEPLISAGDIIIINMQTTLNSGQIGIVKVNGNDATCKKIFIHKDGMSLVSINQNYLPIFYTMSQIENEPITIVGRVIEIRKKV